MMKMITSAMSMLLAAIFAIGGTGCSARIETGAPVTETRPAVTAPAAKDDEPAKTEAPARTAAPETDTKESEAPVETKPVEAAPAAAEFGSVEAIKAVAGLQAECQTKESACAVWVDSDANPYDVEWNYGGAYDAYVAACDWSLVFDVEYYDACQTTATAPREAPESSLTVPEPHERRIFPI